MPSSAGSVPTGDEVRQWFLRLPDDFECAAPIVAQYALQQDAQQLRAFDLASVAEQAGVQRGEMGPLII